MFSKLSMFPRRKPKVMCFHCGKRFRLGDRKERVMHYVIPNSDMILIVYFCSWKCHDSRIVDRSFGRNNKIIAEVRG
jgi:hypothetical protein